MRKLIPWSMTLGRIFFAPALILLARRGSGWPLAVVVVLEVVLDIFDGMVARRLGVATSLLRRMDSLVDTIFYIAVLYCAWKLYPDALLHRAALIIALLSMEAVRYAFDSLKFHREAAYHMWSSKAWGLLLGASVVALLGFNRSGWLLTAALIGGILCDIEGLLISILLRESVEDVPHVFRALELRKQQKLASRSMAASGSSF